MKCQAFESLSLWQRVGTKGRVVSGLWLCTAERRKGIFYLWGGSIGDPSCTHSRDQIEVLRPWPAPWTWGPLWPAPTSTPEPPGKKECEQMEGRAEPSPACMQPEKWPQRLLPPLYAGLYRACSLEQVQVVRKCGQTRCCRHRAQVEVGTKEGTLRRGDQKVSDKGRKNHQHKGPEAAQNWGYLRTGRKARMRAGQTCPLQPLLSPTPGHRLQASDVRGLGHQARGSHLLQGWPPPNPGFRLPASPCPYAFPLCSPVP